MTFNFFKISETVEPLLKLIKAGKENINSKITNAAGNIMKVWKNSKNHRK